MVMVLAATSYPVERDVTKRLVVQTMDKANADIQKEYLAASFQRIGDVGAAGVKESDEVDEY